MEPFRSTLFDSDDEPIALVKKSEPDYTRDRNKCPGTSSAEPVAVDAASSSKSTDLSKGKTKRAKSVDDCIELATVLSPAATKRKLRAEKIEMERKGNDILACFMQRAEKKTETEKSSTALVAASSSVGSPLPGM